MYTNSTNRIPHKASYYEQTLKRLGKIEISIISLVQQLSRFKKHKEWFENLYRNTLREDGSEKASLAEKTLVEVVKTIETFEAKISKLNHKYQSLQRSLIY